MSTIRTNTLLHSDGSTTTEPSIPALDKRMAKAWVNFDMSTPSSINKSHNVSSLTDNGVGDFYVNFSNNMTDTNYAHFADAYDVNQNASLIIAHTSSIKNVGSAIIYAQNTGGDPRDADGVSYLVFSS